MPEELSSVEGAPLMCAGITTFNALRNSGARGGDVVGVLGIGGLDHLGVQFAAKMGFKEEQVHHPRSPNLRATLHLKQLSSAGVARPHFLIECEDLRRSAERNVAPAGSSLPHLVRLTAREQEVARLICGGRSNQEIADAAGLSLPMVKKHLHAIFQKLEVTSRSRLMTLMR